MDLLNTSRKSPRGKLHTSLSTLTAYALFRLASILKKRTLSDEKLDQIQIKANVLAAFAKKQAEAVAEAVEEAAEAVGEKARQVKEEL